MYKVYVSAGLFLGLSALKLLAPGQSEQIRQQVLDVIRRDENFPQMVEALGRKLSQGDLKEELLEALGLQETEKMLANAKEAIPDVQLSFAERDGESGEPA